MRVHGGARSAAVRGAIVRLRGLSEIATNPPRLIFREQPGRRSPPPAHPRNRHRQAASRHDKVRAAYERSLRADIHRLMGMCLQGAPRQ